jgi:hypothetical protein
MHIQINVKKVFDKKGGKNRNKNTTAQIRDQC